MELLFKRNISDALKKMLLCIFALGGFASAGVLQAQNTALPVLSWGVNLNATNYSNDVTKSIWYPDNRIWVAPKKVVSGTQVAPESEILVPVFIENRWANFRNAPGVTLHEISSFSFRAYYDSRTLEFVEVVKEHPFTAEEATNLASTHFFTLNSSQEAYYKPLGYNFNMVADVRTVNDYGKYFNRDAVPAQDASTGDYFGKTVTITGTANSFFNLPTTNAGEYKVLVYLKFKVANAYDGVPNIAAFRTSNLYFDPTYICYNGINITKDRGDKLIEQMPLSNADPNWTGYMNMFGTAYYNLYIGRSNDNMKYLDRSRYFKADTLAAPELVPTEIEYRSVGLPSTNNNLRLKKFAEVPYLPGSIQVRVMNYIPEFTFEAVNYYTNIVRPAVNIAQSDDDPAQWTMVEPITADLLQSERVGYRNQSERAIRVTIESNKAGATDLPRDPAFVMEDIIIETDQPWLKVRTVPHLEDPLAANYEDKFGNNNADNTRRRAFAQRINRLISTPNDDAYNPFADTKNTNTGAVPKNFIMWVECDPALITPKAPGVVDDQDLCGEYIGHVTFRSKYDKYEKTSIQVRFIVIASPEERIPNAPATSVEVPYGLKLTITPNDGKSLDLARTLVLGSSDFATDQSDSLAGEYVREQALGYDRNATEQAFDARFFIDPAIYTLEAFIESGLTYKTERTAQDTIDLQNQWNNLVNFGFGDYTHRDGVYNSGLPGGVTDNKATRTGSRDIRSTTAGAQSHMFFVKYRISSAGSANDWFPVVLRWDPKQIQAAGTTCHLKYIHNAGEETVDMKTTSSFVFHDIHVNHFWIEYTVSKNEYAGLDDNFGDDIIQANAWNLVSLPLDPVNKYWRSVYPNTVTIPYEYNSSNWQEKENLEPGVGYFVKYLDVKDNKFQGAYIDRIDPGTYPVRLWRTGSNAYWNAIGALSKVVSVDNVSLAQYEDYVLEDADRTEMIKNGLWAYRPKEGYKRVYQLFPGKGYFIRVTKPAYLVVDGSSKSTFDLPGTIPNYTAGFDMINIADASQHNANVFAAKRVMASDFALPPAPPLEMFDVRFIENNYATNYDNPHNVVKMQGVTYPVTISLDKPKANYSIVDPITNEVYGTVKAGTNGSVVINSSSSNSFKLQIEGSDESFFVNVNNSPVNTNTADVTLGINSDANVSLSLFNALGNEVAKVDLGYLTAGVTNHQLDVANLASGVYTLRLLAGNEMKTFMMHIVK